MDLFCQWCVFWCQRGWDASLGVSHKLAGVSLGYLDVMLYIYIYMCVCVCV